MFADDAFEMSGGRLCLDFTNTLLNRSSNKSKELLKKYSNLVAWGLQAGVLTEEQALHFTQLAFRNQAEAARTLQEAVNLREALYRIFSAVAGGHVPDKSGLDALNAWLRVLGMSQIVREDQSFIWGWKHDEEPFDRVIWPVVRSALELLTSGDRDRVRECAEDTCTWLFMDSSPNRSRRWCDMKTCGNRVKARQRYQRQKASCGRAAPSQ